MKTNEEILRDLIDVASHYAATNKNVQIAIENAEIFLCNAKNYTPTIGESEFLAARLRRVAKLVGAHPHDEMTPEQIVEVAGTILGNIAAKIEKQQQVMSDAQIMEISEYFKTQYRHGGTIFDEFDYMGFARAVLKASNQSTDMGEALKKLDRKVAVDAHALAWMVPRILTFKGRRTSCPIEHQSTFEGTVAWSAEIFCDDFDPVKDKHGVEHVPYALGRIVEISEIK